MTAGKTITHSGRIRNMASVYLRRGSDILLLYRQGSSIVNNLWIGSAGGHFEIADQYDAKSCVLRELQEELNLSVDSLRNLTLRYVTIRYTNGELRQNYYFFADLIAPETGCPVSNEGTTKWFSLPDLDDLPMPFTARFMIDHYIAIGQYTDALYGGIADSTSVTFIKL